MNPYDFDTTDPQPKRARRSTSSWTGAELAFAHTYDPAEELVDVKPLPVEHPEDETTEGSWCRPPAQG